MAFQFIWALIWLIPIGGFIVLLYFLKMRRKDTRVPAVFLWPKVMTDVRANAFFQKLKPNILLFLQLLFTALIVLALAKPVWKTNRALANATVIIIDNSASMGAIDTAPTRLDAAKKRALDLINSMTHQDNIAIIEAGSSTKSLCPLTNDKSKLRNAVNAIPQTDAPNDMGSALRLASAICGNAPSARILLLSDGSFPAVADFSQGKAEFVFESFGSSKDNIAITALSVGDLGNDKQLYVGIKNYSNTQSKGVLSISADSKVINSKEIVIEPDNINGQSLVIPANAKRIDVELEAADMLPRDNRGTLFLASNKPTKILLVGPGDFFLERALALETNVEVSKAPVLPAKERAGSPEVSEFDMVIFENAPTEPVKATAVIYIAVTGGDSPVSALTEVKTPKIASWRKDNPLLFDVDLNSVLIDMGFIGTPQPWATPIIETQNGPLAVYGFRQGKHSLWIGWLPTNSDLPLRPAFPILIANILDTFIQQRTGSFFNIKTGDNASITVSDSKQVQLQKPNSESNTLDVIDGMVSLKNADCIGAYRLQDTKTTLEIAANLLNSSESNIEPKPTLQLSGKTITKSESKPALRDLWKIAGLIGLLILAVEWWVYARRS